MSQYFWLSRWKIEQKAIDSCCSQNVPKLPTCEVWSWRWTGIGRDSDPILNRYLVTGGLSWPKRPNVFVQSELRISPDRLRGMIEITKTKIKLPSIAQNRNKLFCDHKKKHFCVNQYDDDHDDDYDDNLCVEVARLMNSLLIMPFKLSTPAVLWISSSSSSAFFVPDHLILFAINWYARSILLLKVIGPISFACRRKG